MAKKNLNLDKLLSCFARPREVLVFFFIFLLTDHLSGFIKQVRMKTYFPC